MRMRASGRAKMREQLIRAAASHSTVSYGTLMKVCRLSRGRALSRAIADVDREEYAAGAPGFAAVIVRKDTGFPGGGYFCDDGLPSWLVRDRDRSTDPRLSLAEKDYVIGQQRRIWAYYGEGRRARP
jgi:hypothetical protein